MKYSLSFEAVTLALIYSTIKFFKKKKSFHTKSLIYIERFVVLSHFSPVFFLLHPSKFLHFISSFPCLFLSLAKLPGEACFYWI